MVVGPRDDVMDFIRIRVKIDVTQPIKQGTYLRLRGGSRKWVAFTYERMPMFCYLCGMVGHMEKWCTTRYSEEFVDPGSNFPYGEWLKAAAVGDISGGAPLPLQPIPSPAASLYSHNLRGIQVFGLSINGREFVGPLRDGGNQQGGGGSGRGNENAGLAVTGGSKEIFTSQSSSTHTTRKRKVVTPTSKNRKNKEVVQFDGVDEMNGRPSKQKQIGDTDDLIEVSVEAAKQPHQLQ